MNTALKMILAVCAVVASSASMACTGYSGPGGGLYTGPGGGAYTGPGGGAYTGPGGGASTAPGGGCYSGPGGGGTDKWNRPNPNC